MKENTFAARLKRLRAEAGLTQAQLAEKTGMARSAIAKLEGAVNSPSWPTVQRLAAGLGVDCRAFQEGEGAGEKAAAPKKPAKGAKKKHA